MAVESTSAAAAAAAAVVRPASVFAVVAVVLVVLAAASEGGLGAAEDHTAPATLRLHHLHPVALAPAPVPEPGPGLEPKGAAAAGQPLKQTRRPSSSLGPGTAAGTNIAAAG